MSNQNEAYLINGVSCTQIKCSSCCESDQLLLHLRSRAYYVIHCPDCGIDIDLTLFQDTLADARERYLAGEESPIVVEPTPEVPLEIAFSFQ